MKVKELIEKLEKMEQDMDVRVGEESEYIEYGILDVVEEEGDVRIEYRKDEDY